MSFSLQTCRFNEFGSSVPSVHVQVDPLMSCANTKKWIKATRKQVYFQAQMEANILALKELMQICYILIVEQLSK